MNAASLFGGGAIRKEFSKKLRIVLCSVLIPVVHERFGKSLNMI